jgi:DNA-binding transcriptional LysR family regulator
MEVSELSGLDLVSVNRSGPIGDLVETALEKAQVEMREIVSVNTYYIAAALVRFGSGIAIVDEFTARSTVSQGLEAIAIAPEMQFGVQALWLEDRPPSKLGLRFVAAVEEALRR